MASRLSLTEVLEVVLDDDSDDFGLYEDESSMKAYLLMLDSTT